VLRAAGFRTARYTSPHLVRLEERFVVDGREIDTSSLAAAVDTVRDAVNALTARGELDAPATFFECTTAAAFELFARADLDIAVLEVGLGGRLDATNVVTPLVTAITTIDLDHQAQLGSTIAEIAAEKAGIIKPGVPVVIGRLPVEAQEVVEHAARSRRAPLIRAMEAAEIPSGTRLALAGAHQRDNARVAIAVLRALADFKVADAAIKEGLEAVRWPGRLEHMTHGTCEVVIDAAHNPAGARTLAAYLSELGWCDATLVFGAMADKDARAMLDHLAPAVGRIVTTTAPTHRAESAAALARLAHAAAATKRVEIVEDPVGALKHACADSDRVVVAGSIFLIGPLRDILR
jgi:dihydrofolate synthase/folylpolyglutamate synthase